MKSGAIVFLLLACHLNAGPIEDVVARLDRHGLWMNGTSSGAIELPLDAPDDELAARSLSGSTYGGRNLRVLGRKNIEERTIGLTGFRAIHVASDKLVFLPLPASEKEEQFVKFFRYDGPGRGWWGRIFRIEIRNEK